MTDRNQGQLVTADGELQLAALPPAVTPDPGLVWVDEHPQVITDLAEICARLIAHPSCHVVPCRLAWETLRHQYRMEKTGVSLPNNFQGHAFARLVRVRPRWASYFPKATPA